MLPKFASCFATPGILLESHEPEDLAPRQTKLASADIETLTTEQWRAWQCLAAPIIKILCWLRAVYTAYLQSLANTLHYQYQ